jgi:tetratricopeptide (TPR) repeat protein
MKAEERHRLHENELHRFTEHARERSRPFFEQYGTTLLLVLAAVLLVLAAVVWWMKSSGSGATAGWQDLSAAFRKPTQTAEDFANVAELHPETAAAAWAKLNEGEAHLQSGIESLFADRDGAARDLDDAEAAFEAVLDSQQQDPELRVRALYGLAKTFEASSDGDLKPALDRYEEVVRQYPDTVYEGLAQERIDALKSADAKAFYAWFSKQKPAPQDTLSRPSDSGLLPGMSPFTPPIGSGPANPAVPDASAPIEAPRPRAAGNVTAPSTEPAPAEQEAANGETSSPADASAAAPQE